MKMAFIGDSLVSCPNVTLTETWPDIAGKKLGLEVVNNGCRRQTDPGDAGDVPL